MWVGGHFFKVSLCIWSEIWWGLFVPREVYLFWLHWWKWLSFLLWVPSVPLMKSNSRHTRSLMARHSQVGINTTPFSRGLGDCSSKASLQIGTGVNKKRTNDFVKRMYNIFLGSYLAETELLLKLFFWELISMILILLVYVNFGISFSLCAKNTRGLWNRMMLSPHISAVRNGTVSWAWRMAPFR